MDNGEFNVEDVFFGALLGAWCGTVAATWVEVITIILLAMLFLLFGTSFRVLFSGRYEIGAGIASAIVVIFFHISLLTIGRLYYDLGTENTKQATFLPRSLQLG